MSQGYLLYSNVSALSGQVPSSCWSCIQNLECARTSSSETCHRRPHPQCGIDFSIQNTAVNGVTDSQPLWSIWLRWIHGLAQVFHLKTVFGLFLMPECDCPIYNIAFLGRANSFSTCKFPLQWSQIAIIHRPSKWCSFPRQETMIVQDAPVFSSLLHWSSVKQFVRFC